MPLRSQGEIGSRRRRQLLVAGAMVCCVGVAGVASAVPRRLGGHVPPAVQRHEAAVVGRLPASQPLAVAVGLPLRNRDELQRLLDDLSDPASPRYRHFLGVAEFTERFGPTAADYAAVVRFAEQQHLVVKATHGNRLVIDLGGSVQQLESAFATTLVRYRHPTENRTFFAPSVEPSADAALPIFHVSGLDDFAPPRPMDLERLALGATIHADATGSGPNSTFIGSDFRAAYAPGATLTGAGQTVGLFEFGPYNLSDVQAWFSQAKLPLNVPITNVLLDGVTGVCGTGCDDGEEVLDIDMAIAMAPGLKQVIVYEGNNAADMFNRMATDNAAKQLSCSFGFLPPDPNLTQIFLELQAQGQNLFVASGDSGAVSAKNPVFAPGDDPNVVVVGGTSLTTNGAGGSWKSETAWKGSLGGISTNDFPRPSYQANVVTSANQGSTTLRNIPDVASNADGNMFLFANGNGGIVGGTSAAAPTWAGFMALANEEAAKHGLPPVGFLNPTFYQLGQGARHADFFHDITSGDNVTTDSPNLFSAVVGYDLVTGWGSPVGQALIDELAGVSEIPDMAVTPDLAVARDLAAPHDAAVGTTDGGDADVKGGCEFGGAPTTTTSPLAALLGLLLAGAVTRRRRG
jgi:subtilase family serine protease